LQGITERPAANGGHCRRVVALQSRFGAKLEANRDIRAGLRNGAPSAGC
jgi:hypothetical protein